ncbi:MAG: hypothetical protein Kow0032_13860 [Methyloligellaceae bacterium]
MAAAALLLIVPAATLALFWIHISMQMARPGAWNFALFYALCAAGVLFLLMQLAILGVGYSARARGEVGRMPSASG